MLSESLLLLQKSNLIVKSTVTTEPINDKTEVKCTFIFSVKIVVFCEFEIMPYFCFQWLSMYPYYILVTIFTIKV